MLLLELKFWWSNVVVRNDLNGIGGGRHQLTSSRVRGPIRGVLTWITLVRTTNAGLITGS